MPGTKNPLVDEKLSQSVERLQAELAVCRRERDALRSADGREEILEHTSDGFMSLDRDLVVTCFNAAAERLLGRRREDVLGRPLFDAFPQARGSVFEEQYRRALEEDRFLSFETYFGAEPYEDWYEVRVHPHEHGLSVYFRVITESKLVAKALDDSEGRYRAITDAALDAIFCKDIDRRYTFVNPAMTKLFGCSEAFLLGKAPEEVYAPAEAAMVREVDDRSFNGEMVSEIRRITLQGQDFVFHTIQGPLEVRDGKVLSISGIVRDMTELMRAQEEKEALEAQLIQSQRMDAIGTLAGGIAHDFNNMLGVITGNVSYALSCLDRDNELYEVLSDIEEGAKKAKSLTEQLLTFSRGGEPVKSVVSLNDLVKGSAKFVTRGANAECRYDLSEDLWLVEADPGQIHQSINNLIINAMQAMPDGGVIELSTRNVGQDIRRTVRLPAGDYVMARVKDQGQGIKGEDLPRIFDPYFTTKATGSGLGLATTYSIVKRHGGHIEVHSKVGRGTQVDMYLPAVKRHVRLAETKKPAVHEGSGRVLVMDDQEAILKMMGRLLQRMGYTVACATNGTEAVRMYQEAYASGSPYDLTILDLTVPGDMGGEKTIEALRGIDPNVRAVVSSGYANDPIMKNYSRYGFCGAVSKPYTRDQMDELLGRLFRESKRGNA